jgi:hypothetical protein
MGLRGAEDAHVAATARAEGRTVVTENVTDFASERDIVLAFVLKKNLPAGGGQAAALAKILDRWAQDHPEPYLGHHWPTTQYFMPEQMSRRLKTALPNLIEETPELAGWSFSVSLA